MSRFTDRIYVCNNRNCGVVTDKPDNNWIELHFAFRGLRKYAVQWTKPERDPIFCSEECTGEFIRTIPDRYRLMQGQEVNA